MEHHMPNGDNGNGSKAFVRYGLPLIGYLLAGTFALGGMWTVSKWRVSAAEVAIAEIKDVAKTHVTKDTLDLTVTTLRREISIITETAVRLESKQAEFERRQSEIERERLAAQRAILDAIKNLKKE